jgi:hypothetical protein
MLRCDPDDSLAHEPLDWTTWLQQAEDAIKRDPF